MIKRKNILMLLLICLFSMQTAHAGAEKYIIDNMKTSDAMSGSTFLDGDFSAEVYMSTRLKVWSIMGEPVVNCYHKVDRISILHQDHLVSDIPKSIINKIRINFPAHLFDLSVGTKLRANLICQSGIDRGIGKWSANFPGSPNWKRFLFHYDIPDNGERYPDYADRVSYFSAKDAKALMKEAKKNRADYFSISSYAFPDRSADLSAVKQWYLEQEKIKLAAESKEVEQLEPSRKAFGLLVFIATS